jgi:hypothetical protein
MPCFCTGQTVINGVNFSNANDSIWMTAEFYPEDIVIGDNDEVGYNLANFQAACGKMLTIEKDKTLLRSRFEDEAINAISVMPRGMRFEKLPNLADYFSTIGEVRLKNLSEQESIAFPLVKETYTVVEQWQAILTQVNPLFASNVNLGKFDSLEMRLSIEMTIDISQNQHALFPFGERIIVPLSLKYKVRVDQVSLWRNGKRINLNPEIFRKSTAGQEYTYIYMFNMYKGVLLAEIQMLKSTVEKLVVYEEATTRSNMRDCNVEDDNFQLYPNPNYGKLNIMLNNEQVGNFTFELYNVVGKMQYSETLTKKKNVQKYTIQIPNPRKGTYMYSIVDPAGRRLFTRRLIIVDL